MTTGQLAGQTAIVTGASSGMGRAIAETYGAQGAHVFLVGRTAEPMEESRARIERAGGQASVACFDIRNVEQLQGFIGEVQAQTGRLDILVNNAGISVPDRLADAKLSDWRDMLEINILAVLAGSQAAVRAMRRSGGTGHILTISSIAALHRTSGVYGATKHAVNVIMETLRQELEHDRIRVTTIMPGAVATNFARHYDPEGLKQLLGVPELPFEHQAGQRLPDSVIDQIQVMMQQVLCHPDDVARAALFAVTQPAHVQIAELVVRPPRAIQF